MADNFVRKNNWYVKLLSYFIILLFQSEEEYSFYELQILQAVINNGGSPHLLRNGLAVQEFVKATIGMGEVVKKDGFVIYLDDDNNVRLKLCIYCNIY